MKPPLMTTPGWHGRTDLRTGSGAATAADGDIEGLSVTWKGWTNGGGERASTAAQFLKLGDHTPAAHGPLFSAPGFPAARMAVPASAVPTPAATAPQFPTDEGLLLAPVGTAIERLVLHGRDQLSLTVRFNEGGSLSLKLALRGGEITTQIQTDVPGLESALRSSWNQLAQEWHGRGLKLGIPEFTNAGANAQGHGDAGNRGGRTPGRGQAGSEDEVVTTSASRAAFPAGARRPAHRRGSTATRTPGRNATRGGLKTWA